METERTHDFLYLKENKTKEPKEKFKFIYNYTKEFISSLSDPRILDIGCAAGEFLEHLSEWYPNSSLNGLDVVPELIEKAKGRVKRGTFYLGNIDSGEGLPNKKFDCIFLIGVHSIFNDYTKWIKNIISMADEGGRIYVFGIFNPDPCDVLVNTRPASSSGTWETGWNLFAKKSISDYLDKMGAKYKFTDWSVPLDIEKYPDDPLRSWTFKLENGSRLSVNGTQVLHHFSLLEIKPH